MAFHNTDRWSFLYSTCQIDLTGKSACCQKTKTRLRHKHSKVHLRLSTLLLDQYKHPVLFITQDKILPWLWTVHRKPYFYLHISTIAFVARGGVHMYIVKWSFQSNWPLPIVLENVGSAGGRNWTPDALPVTMADALHTLLPYLPEHLGHSIET